MVVLLKEEQKSGPGPLFSDEERVDLLCIFTTLALPSPNQSKGLKMKDDKEMVKRETRDWPTL